MCAQLLDASGNALFPLKPAGAYMANISVRHTVADAAASVVWAMRNPAATTKNVDLKNIRGRVAFDGTAAAGVSVGYEFIRFNGGDPTTGTTIPIVKKRSSNANSQILAANIQQKSGVLTMTGAVFDAAPFNVIRLPASVTGVLTNFDIDFVAAGTEYEPFNLAAGEGLAIRLHLAAIIGLEIAGSIEWDER